jgi:uncharacterized protein (TIGR02145 family)
MRVYFVAFLLLKCALTFSQSKKEQIEILKNRVDSLNLVISNERSFNNQTNREKDAKITSLESQNTTYNESIKSLKTILQNNELENSRNTKDLELMRKEVERLSAQTQIIKDSLNYYKTIEFSILNDTLFDLPTLKKLQIVNSQTTDNLKEKLILKEQLIENRGDDSVEGELLSDVSGNSYKTVRIGNQVWMAENLKTNFYSNGELIPNYWGGRDVYWSRIDTGAWCNYNDTPLGSTGALREQLLKQNDQKYGKLYNWYAVTDYRNVCPIGWHVPSDSEWKTLIDYLGGQEVAGGKMKIKGMQYWNSPNADATNESNFSGLPGGSCEYDGSFERMSYRATWWSSSGCDTNYNLALGYYLDCLNGSVRYLNYEKHSGFSVRCLKD